MAKAEAKSAHTQAPVWNTYADGTIYLFRLLQMSNKISIPTHPPLASPTFAQ